MTAQQRQLYLKVRDQGRFCSAMDDQIGAAEAQVIAEALKVSKTMADLAVGDAGAQAIAEALKVGTTLIRLSLHRNLIGEVGAKAIAEALKVNKTLEYLDLSSNQIGDAGAQAIAEALKVNTTVTYLDLHNNQIGDAGAKAIAEPLKGNKTLTELNFERNWIGNAGAKALARALEVNTNVITLVLDMNRIGDAGAIAFARAITQNITLRHLDLLFNCMGIAGIQMIDRAFLSVTGSAYPTLSNQFHPLAFSIHPRLATADDVQTVLCLLTSRQELEDQSAALPALPAEIAELIMNEAQYWQGVQGIKREQVLPHLQDLHVTVPRGSNGSSIRVKAIQVVRNWPGCFDATTNPVVDLIVRDEQGAVRYKRTVKPAVIGYDIQVVMVLPATILRQMREGWGVQVQPSISQAEVVLESLYYPDH
ncbi:hypothetical protein CAOG_07295 [Capsaspora owczarzaki ATCC 30864]|uniref:hypothetical protein n=1 Tax=Capsaspora owczarzaki (strain ATCC 30864) TaxID=595528 RepID=UPI0001FE3CF7|nr:hypothetical protein CAOG_07295 [Capsaspora owczarzaki ATCC 30864]|eukprot:XP_004343154.1 hypothetical protein CAOG_07295 [Capsaspora owczarzaki ATCC 30864]